MAQFINIDGTLINLDKVETVSLVGTQKDTVRFAYPVDANGGATNEFSGNNAMRAYEWLQSACVVTFTNEMPIQSPKRYYASEDWRSVELDTWVVKDSNELDAVGKHKVVAEGLYCDDAITMADDMNQKLQTN